MIDEILKVDPIWFRDFILGGEGGLKGWMATIALILISYGFHKMTKVLVGTNIELVRFGDKTEDNSDVVSENTKVIRDLSDDIKRIKK